MIKNIVFDLGSVILKDKPASFLDNLNIDNEIKELIKSTFFSNWRNVDLGKETLKEHLAMYKELSSLSDEIKELLLTYYKYRPYNEEIVEILNKLKANGYGIYVLSNNNTEAYEYLSKEGTLKNVDGWIISSKCHIQKPEIKFYELLFDTYKINPEECYFIDDKLLNIEAGKLLGMNGHVFDYANNNIDNLVQDLRQNGIQI